MKEKVILNWSGGKDSALALYRIMESQQYDIMCLLTTLSEEYRRVSMHGVRLELLEAQAESTGLPLIKIFLPEMPDMATYENAMTSTLKALRAKGASASVFGDIFLEDLRKYREDKLEDLDLKALFPLWKLPTTELIHEFINLGFKTIVTCVSEKHLDKSFAGRIIDHDFLLDLPEDVDPCGENGEFHTFVFDGPIFKKPISFEKGELVYRKYKPTGNEDNAAGALFDSGFWYCDLMLNEKESGII